MIMPPHSVISSVTYDTFHPDHIFNLGKGASVQIYSKAYVNKLSLLERLVQSCTCHPFDIVLYKAKLSKYQDNKIIPVKKTLFKISFSLNTFITICFIF